MIGKWAYIRVHVHPKRFPAVYTVDWKVRDNLASRPSTGPDSKGQPGSGWRPPTRQQPTSRLALPRSMGPLRMGDEGVTIGPA